MRYFLINTAVFCNGSNRNKYVETGGTLGLTFRNFGMRNLILLEDIF